MRHCAYISFTKPSFVLYTVPRGYKSTRKADHNSISKQELDEVLKRTVTDDSDKTDRIHGLGFGRYLSMRLLFLVLFSHDYGSTLSTMLSAQIGNSLDGTTPSLPALPAPPQEDLRGSSATSEKTSQVATEDVSRRRRRERSSSRHGKSPNRGDAKESRSKQSRTTARSHRSRSRSRSRRVSSGSDGEEKDRSRRHRHHRRRHDTRSRSRSRSRSPRSRR